MNPNRPFLNWYYLLVLLSGSTALQAQSPTYEFPRTATPFRCQPDWIGKHSTISYVSAITHQRPTDTVYFCFSRVDKVVLFRREGRFWVKVDSTGDLVPLTRSNPDRQSLRLTGHSSAKTSFRLAISNHFEQQFRPKVTLLNPHDYTAFRIRQLTTQAQEKTSQYIFVGVLLMMFLYAFIQTLLQPGPIYMWYAAYVGGTLCTFLLRFEVIIPEQWGFGQAFGFIGRYSISFFSLSFAAYLLFIHAFSSFRHRIFTRLIYWIVIPMNVVIAIADLFYTVSKYTGNQVFAFFRMSEITNTVVLLITFYFLAKQKNKDYRLLQAGVCALFLGALLQQGLIWYFQDRILYRPLVNISWEVSVFAELAFFLAALSYRNRKMEREKVIAQAQLIEQFQENERKQAKLNGLRDEIARDLHDEMGSQLSSISILSQMTTKLVTDERVQQRLTTIGQTSRQVMESMRAIVWSLNSSSDSLQHIGLRIRETAYSLFSDGPVRLHIHIDEVTFSLGLTEKQRREIHLIAKECLTNIVRHAKANLVNINLEVNANCLQLTISDDGVGFNSDLCSGGLGLSSIRKRAERLNAFLHIESNYREGTTITLLCPLVTEKPLSELPLETISS